MYRHIQHFVSMLCLIVSFSDTPASNVTLVVVNCAKEPTARELLCGIIRGKNIKIHKSFRELPAK